MLHEKPEPFLALPQCRLGTPAIRDVDDHRLGTDGVARGIPFRGRRKKDVHHFAALLDELVRNIPCGIAAEKSRQHDLLGIFP